MKLADIKHFLKLELTGWNKIEKFGLLFVIILIFINAILFHDNPVAVTSAICGIFATILAGKGKISCYMFGAMGTGFYIYLASKNSLWGNALLYLCYYLPMDIVGIFQWSKHLDRKTNEIIKAKLSKKEFVILTTLTILTIICTIISLHFMKDSHPVIDGITTILSIVGMYLTVKRCIEQWLIWTIVNALSVLMWIKVVLSGVNVYATVIMWFVYFLLGIYFYNNWKKELNKKGEV